MVEKNEIINVEEKPISEEELKLLRDPRIYDESIFVEAHDVLNIADTSSIPELKDFHFAWLSPEHRSRVGMGHWRWVNGYLAKLVRQHKIVQEAIGGGSATSLITNGDLILGFMPKVLYIKRQVYLSEKNRQAMDLVKSQETVKGEIDKTQSMESTMRIVRTYEGREYNEDGD